MGFISGLLGTQNNFQANNGIGVDAQKNAAAANDDALRQQQAFAQAASAQNGLGNQSSVFNQLQGVANGQGPNPAQAQLAQATGANNANQAALMAGQRGASQNAGLIARQAGMQGGVNQQNAAGQAATLQANQSLGALNQLGGIAGQQVAQQQAANNAFTQGAQGEQGMLFNAVQGQNQINSGVAQQNAATNQSIAGGIAGAGGKALKLFSQGGLIHAYADGGEVHEYGRNLYAEGGKVPALVSPGEIYLSPEKAKKVASGKESPMNGQKIPGKAKVKGNSYVNDTVPRTLEEGGVVIPRSELEGSDRHKKAAEFVAAIIGGLGNPSKKKK